MDQRGLRFEQRDDIVAGFFGAMASPCEILIQTRDIDRAHELIEMGANETWRIEQKFSRYNNDNIVHAINNAQGKTIEVDDETANLLDFAEQCYNISEGQFDITSGILRRVWDFSGGNKIPTQHSIDTLLKKIGWHRITWTKPRLTLPDEMQIDFGGIGKEYAVDKALTLLTQHTHEPTLVNLGGDLNCNKARTNQLPWITGIENPAFPGEAYNTLELYQGALATSGDAFRFIENNGIRYSHILNPKTGWPALNAPHSVTVAAQNCTEAGILATLAMLHGDQAEGFLQSQQVKFWVYR